MYSPFSGETLAKVARCGESHVEAALELAHATFNDKTGWLTVSKSIEIMRLAAIAMKGMEGMQDALTVVAASEASPLWTAV